MKRSRDEAYGSKEPLPLLLNKQNQHLTQTSLKEHFRVTKPRHAGKENVSVAGAVSPPTKTIKSPLVMAPISRRLAAMMPAPVSLSLMPPAATPSAATLAFSSAPVLSDCGISLSTAPFVFPAPSEDTAATADISSRLPSHGAGKAGMLLPRQHPCAGPAQLTTDTDEISCRHRPLPARPARLLNRTNSAATFSSDACGAGSAARREHSTASLASWLPAGKGTSSMQAADACAAEESDCEDDAVSQRWTLVPPVAAPVAPDSILPEPTPAQTGPDAASDAASSGGSTAQLLPSSVMPTSDLTPGQAAASRVSGSEESYGGAVFMPVMLELAQGGAVAGPAEQQEAGRVLYHTRLEELLFGMNYVAPATDESDGAEE